MGGKRIPNSPILFENEVLTLNFESEVLLHILRSRFRYQNFGRRDYNCWTGGSSRTIDKSILPEAILGGKMRFVVKQLLYFSFALLFALALPAVDTRRNFNSPILIDMLKIERLFVALEKHHSNARIL